MIRGRTCVAIDTSARSAVMAVTHNDKVLSESCMPVLGKASKGLAEAVIAELDKVGVGLSDVDQWLVGMGPGSFSGIRSGAALVKGFARGSRASCGGVPSSLAMASAISPDPLRIIILHDGRRGEVICSPFSAESSQLRAETPYAAPIKELSRDASITYVMLEDDSARAAVEDAVGEISTLPQIPVAAMTKLPPGPLDPIYVRPAVFVPPKAVRPTA